jgi:hypothetical protein
MAMSFKGQNAVVVNALDTCHALVMMFPMESPPALMEVLKENLAVLERHKNNSKVYFYSVFFSYIFDLFSFLTVIVQSNLFPWCITFLSYIRYLNYILTNIMNYYLRMPFDLS